MLYLKKAYGYKTELKTKEDIILQFVNPFSNEWTLKFGFPQLKSENYKHTCFNPTKFTAYGQGKIK